MAHIDMKESEHTHTSHTAAVASAATSQNDSTHTIIKTAKRFLSGTMLSRVSGMARDMAMAFAFGTQDAVAAFLVAFRFAHLLRRLFGEGAMQSAFIPQFESLRSSHPQRATRFFCDLLGVLSVGLTLLIIFVMVLIGALLFTVDFSEGNREILFLTLLLMPSLLFICLFGLNASLLQCEKSYFTPGVAPVAFNVVWIIGALMLWKVPVYQAMPWLAGWVILACFCQWMITVPRIWAILKSHGVASSWYRISFASSDVKGLAKPLLLGILGVAATQVNSAFDAIFARYADGEGPALLWYALRVQQLPLALFGVAIAGALLPPLTRALKANDIANYHHFLEFTLRRSMALMLPITAAFFVMGDSCINLLYGRGDFTDLSTVGTTQCLWGYCAGLVPMTLVLILAPAFYAKGNQRTPAIASVVAMSANIGLNAFMITVLGLGAASVAFATSISACINVILLRKVLTQTILSQAFLMSVGRVLLATLIASSAVVALDVFFLQGSTAWQIIQGDVPVYPHGLTSQLARLSMQAACFLLVMWGVAWKSGKEGSQKLEARSQKAG